MMGYRSRKSIVFISIDDNNDIIVGKENHLFVANEKQLLPLQLTGDTTSYYKINCFKKDSRNITWIGTSKGVFVLKNKSLVRVDDPNLNGNINITSISEDVYGNLWAVKDKKEFFLIKI